MLKSDNPHAMRLHDALQKHADNKIADDFILQFPLSKAADFKKKFVWAQQICTALEQQFDEDTVKAIRMDCACGPELGKMNALQKLYRACDGMEDFAPKATGLHQGFEVRYEGDSLFLIYPTCYCSCVKRVNKTLPRAWCDCTLGYTKRMFSYVLGRAVEVELIESVKLGGDKCVIKIT